MDATSEVDVRAEDLKGTVDFAIITIREDEFLAVLQRFPNQEDVKGNRTYSLTRVELPGGGRYTVVTAKSIEQGEASAQDLARDIIEDLDPRWLLLVGIAGSVPAPEYTLGDVVAATRLSDFSVSAAVEGAKREFAVGGGPMHKQVQDLLAYLPAWLQRVEGWNEEESISRKRPPVSLGGRNFYGAPSSQAKVRESLKRHFGPTVPSRPPLVTAGPIASSDTLIKDTALIEDWRRSARHILAVEMELSGVYQAARRIDREYPILAIRGISDVIGFRRDPDWTGYACHTAAAFAYALIRSRPIDPRSPSTGEPGTERDDIPILASEQEAVSDGEDIEELRSRGAEVIAAKVVMTSLLRDSQSGRLYMAAVGERSRDGGTESPERVPYIERRAYLLEQVGRVFRIVCFSAPLRWPIAVGIRKLLDHGGLSLFVADEEFGEIGGSRSVSVYPKDGGDPHQLTEYFNWACASAAAYTLATDLVSGSDADRQIEGWASEQGLLQGSTIDFEAPGNCLINWRRLNANEDDGHIEMVFYPSPLFEDRDIELTCEYAGVSWYVHSNGALYGRLTASGEDFVAYVPQPFAGRVSSIAPFCGLLFFGVIGASGLFSLKYEEPVEWDGRTLTLRVNVVTESHRLSEIHSIEATGEAILLNAGEIEIRHDELQQLSTRAEIARELDTEMPGDDEESEELDPEHAEKFGFSLSEYRRAQIYRCIGAPQADADYIATVVVDSERVYLVGVSGDTVAWSRPFLLRRYVNTAKCGVRSGGLIIEIWTQAPFVATTSSQFFSWDGSALVFLSEEIEDGPAQTVKAAIDAAERGDEAAALRDDLGDRLTPYSHEYVNASSMCYALERVRAKARRLSLSGSVTEACRRMALMFRLTRELSDAVAGATDEMMNDVEAWIAVWTHHQVDRSVFSEALREYSDYLTAAGDHAGAQAVLHELRRLEKSANGTLQYAMSPDVEGVKGSLVDGAQTSTIALESDGRSASEALLDVPQCNGEPGAERPEGCLAPVGDWDSQGSFVEQSETVGVVPYATLTSEAATVAERILGPTVLEALSFAFGGRGYIAAIHERVERIEVGGEVCDRVNERRVVLLVQLGLAYRESWSSEPLAHPWKLNSMDLTGKGDRVFSFLDEQYGMTGGSRSLFVYSLQEKILYSIEDLFNWGHPSGGEYAAHIAPELPEKLRPELEVYSVDQGVLLGRVVDFSDSKNARSCWRQMNWTLGYGRVRPLRTRVYYRLYPGTPGPVIVSTFGGDGTGIIWMIASDGAVYCYRQGSDDHLLAFLPDSTLDRPAFGAVAFDRFWFSMINSPGLASLWFQGADLHFQVYSSFKEFDFKYIESLRIDGATLIVNELAALAEGELELLVSTTAWFPFVRVESYGEG